MRKNVLLLVSVLLLLGIGMAFANGVGRTINRTAMSCCCCKGDSCPLKNKDKTSASSTAKDDCDCPLKTTDKASADTMSPDNCDCCAGDSCPMKMKGDHKDSMTMPATTDATSGDAKSCDCPCCHHDKNTTNTDA